MKDHIYLVYLQILIASDRNSIQLFMIQHKEAIGQTGENIVI